jgi:DNA-binding PadR family transcriptional regulator
LSWLRDLQEIAQPADGRVAPTFKSHHVAVAVIMIGREQPLGRYELCERLSVGEGTARTLLKRLTESGYIRAEGRQGQKLTERGEDLFGRITKDIPIGLALELGDLVVHAHSYANLVKGKASDVKDGVRQRDEAIIQGGHGNAGATTLIKKNGLLVMPPDDFNILLDYSDQALLIADTLRVEENDVVIIGSAEDANLAREVSMAAVLTLFNEG